MSLALTQMLCKGAHQATSVPVPVGSCQCQCQWAVAMAMVLSTIQAWSISSLGYFQVTVRRRQIVKVQGSLLP